MIRVEATQENYQQKKITFIQHSSTVVVVFLLSSLFLPTRSTIFHIMSTLFRVSCRYFSQLCSIDDWNERDSSDLWWFVIFVYSLQYEHSLSSDFGMRFEISLTTLRKNCYVRCWDTETWWYYVTWNVIFIIRVENTITRSSLSNK